MNRRALLAGGAALAASLVAGCGQSSDDRTDTGAPGDGPNSSPVGDGREADSGSSGRPAHTVSTYLSDREATRDVVVTVRNGSGEALFEREYQLSDDNESDEDATFPTGTDPETVVVTVDGTRFERDWPGFEQPELPCDGENWTGVELYVEGGPDEFPDVRLEANCQHVTVGEK